MPLQDVQRINASGVAEVLQGPELRTIFLGFDQMRPELKYSNVKGKNPFKDVRVRQAFYLAIDENAIAQRVMREAAVPSALMISPLLFDLAKDFKRPAPDPEKAKKLLAEAGYPNGFEVEMDCPNDRYVNDEAICQAVTAMLARIGMKINLNAQPKTKYFAKVLQGGGYDTSFFLLGWTPGSFDSWNVLANMYRCRDEKGVGGNNNLGGYCNPKVEELTNRILVEPDKGKRDQMIKEAYQIGQEQDWGYVPLHQQALAWGVSKKVKLDPARRQSDPALLVQERLNAWTQTDAAASAISGERKLMKLKTDTFRRRDRAASLVQPAAAATFRLAFQGDLKSLDPYSLNETFTHGMLGNVYEGLTKRDKDLKIMPGLAERWEVVEPTRWRFHLRKGVKFHNGEDFTADDVVFSAARAHAPASDIKTRLPGRHQGHQGRRPHGRLRRRRARIPILHAEWDTWYILSKKWAEANGSAQPQPRAGQQMSHAALHANGTGPFTITEPSGGREDDVQAEPEMVGQAGAQFRRGDLHHHLE